MGSVAYEMYTHCPVYCHRTAAFLDAELCSQLLDFSLQRCELIIDGTLPNMCAPRFLLFSIGVVTTTFEPCLQMSPQRWTAKICTQPHANQNQGPLMPVATKAEQLESRCASYLAIVAEFSSTCASTSASDCCPQPVVGATAPS